MKKKGKNFYLIRNIVFVVLLIIFLLQMVLFGMLRMNTEWVIENVPYRLLEVASDSMYPVLKTGDCVVIRTGGYDNVEPGDMVSFYSAGSLITHEVIERTEDGRLITQGCANEFVDSAIGESEYLGKVLFHVPGLGTALRLAQTAKTRAMMIALIIVVLLGPEIFSGIYDLAVKGSQKRKEKQTEVKR